MSSQQSRHSAAIAAALVCALALQLGQLVATAGGGRAEPSCGASPAGQRFTRTELLLGLSQPDGSPVTDAEFQRFVETQVAPRLPDGFTVVAGSGQFRNARGTIVRESARVLVVLHPERGGRQSRAIEEIRAAYKAAYRQESVARVDGRSCASF